MRPIGLVVSSSLLALWLGYTVVTLNYWVLFASAVTLALATFVVFALDGGLPGHANGRCRHVTEPIAGPAGGPKSSLSCELDAGHDGEHLDHTGAFWTVV